MERSRCFLQLRKCGSYSSVTKAWTKLRIIERESSGSTYRFVEICKGMKEKEDRPASPVDLVPQTDRA